MGRDTNRKVHNWLSVLLFAGLFVVLTACGNPAQPAASEEPATPPVLAFDWKTDVFQMTDSATEGKQYQMATYHEWEHAKSDKENTRLIYSYATDGKFFLTGVKEVVYTEDMSAVQSTQYYKESMNPATGEVTKETITEEEFQKLFGDIKEAGKLPPLEQYAEGSLVAVNGVAYSDDRELLYAVYNEDENTQEIKWYDKETKTERVLGEVPYRQFISLVNMKGAYLYYVSLNDLVRWNVETGEREKIFSTKDNGMSQGSTRQLIIGEDDTLYLRCVNDAEDWMTGLTAEEPDRGDPIKIIDIANDVTDGNIVSSAAAVYIRKNPLYSVDYEIDKKDAENYRTRVLADVTAGKGPDILVVSVEDMENLAKKGWTADLREYISGDTLEKILPGIIQIGTVDGKLMGIAPEMDAYGLFTHTDVWDKETWTFEDVIGLMEQTKRFDVMMQGTSPRYVMRMLLKNNLTDSPFIDSEAGESHFEKDDFIRLLTLSLQYEPEELTDEEELQQVRSGRVIMNPTNLVEFHSYVKNVQLLGENINVIGYPSQIKSANYVRAGKILLVNKDTTKKQEVSAFLECILSEYTQDLSTIGSVRRNMVKEEDVFERDGQMVLQNRDGSLTIIGEKWEGNTYVKEYNEALKKCIPQPVGQAVLEEIIFEELDVFYDGGRSAKETAKIIDNRVQLYLDEQR